MRAAVDSVVANRLRRLGPLDPGHLKALLVVLPVAAAAGWLAVARPDLFEVDLPSSPAGVATVALILVAAPAAVLAMLRRPVLAVVLLIAFVELHLSEVLVRHHALPSLLQLLALPLAVVGLRLRGIDGSAAVATSPTTLALGGYLAVIAASTTWAADPALADERLAVVAKATLVYLLVALVAAGPRLLRAATWAAVGSGSLLALLGVWQASTGAFRQDFGGLARVKQAQIYGDVFEPRIAGPLGDPNFFAQLLLVLVPLALALAWGEGSWTGSRGLRRGLALGAAGLLVAGTVLTYSRGAVLALVVVIASALLLRGVRMRHLVAGVVVVLAVALLSPAGFTRRLNTLGEMLPGGEEVLDPDSSFAKRRLVTAAAWRMFLDRPEIGVGAGNYATHFFPYAERVGTDARLWEEPGERNFPHNLYLEIAAESGLLGSVAYAAVLATVFGSLFVARRRLRRSGDVRTAALAEGVGLALVGYLVTGLFLHDAFPRYPYLLFGFATALLLTGRTSGSGSPSAVAAAQEPVPPQPVSARVRPPVAVLLSRFPLVTETFILREIEELERQGQPIVLAPLIREHPEVVHREAESWVGRALFTPWMSRTVAAAFLRQAARRPLRLLATVLRLVGGSAGSPSMLWRSLALFPKAVLLAERLDAAGVGHLHAHFATHPATAALIAGRLSGLGFSFTVHAHDLFVDRHLLSWKLREAAFVRVISRFNRDLIADLHPWAAEKLVVVHVGVECGGEDAGTLPAGNDEPLVLCVAALKEYKGIAVLIEACRILRDEGTAFRCQVIGSGPLEAELEAQIDAAELAGYVDLVGAMRQDQVARRMSTARIVVQPSVVAADGQMEGIPVASMEALAAGRPLVASRLSGIPELVVDGETGLLVPPGDPVALAAAIRRLLEDPRMAARLGEAGRRRVARDFELGGTMAALLRELDRHGSAPSAEGAALAVAAAPGGAVGLVRFHRGRDAAVAEVLVPRAGGEPTRRVVKRHLDRDGASRPAAARARHERAVAERVAAWDGAPRPLADTVGAEVIVFAHCPGEPLDEMIRRLRRRPSGETELAAAVAAAGRWLARYQATPLADLLAPGGKAGDPPAPVRVEASDDPFGRRLASLATRARPESLAPAPLHGDLWPGNLRIDHGVARAIDFEGAVIGPRYADAAWFLLHLDLYLDRPGLGRRRRTLTDAFLAGWLGADEAADPHALALLRALAARRLLRAGGHSGLRSRWRRRRLRQELRTVGLRMDAS